MSEVGTTVRAHGRLESASHQDAAEEVVRLGPWFHNLHLPDGTQTAPQHLLGDFPAVKWRQIAPLVPADLEGCRALDIGCNAGFYSFELARRGAEVTAMDIEPRYLEQARWAARQFRARGAARPSGRRPSTSSRARESGSISSASSACCITCAIRCSRWMWCTASPEAG